MSKESGIPSLKLSREMEKLAWEARARIIWGASVNEISDWLSFSGANDKTVRRIIRLCLRERARSVRLKGLRDVLIGAALLIIGAGLFAVAEFAVPKEWQLGARRRIPRMIGAVGAAAVFFGICFSGRGISRLVLGARMKGGVSDVTDF